MRLKVVHLVLQKNALLFDSKHSKIENADVKEIYEAINHNIIYVGGYRLSSIRMIGSNKKFPLPYELEEIMTVFFEKYNALFR